MKSTGLETWELNQHFNKSIETVWDIATNFLLIQTNISIAFLTLSLPGASVCVSVSPVMNRDVTKLISIFTFKNKKTEIK